MFYKLNFVVLFHAKLIQYFFNSSETSWATPLNIKYGAVQHIADAVLASQTQSTIHTVW